MATYAKTIRNACIATAIVGLAFAAPAAATIEPDEGNRIDDDGPCFYINPWVFPPVVRISNDPLHDCI